MARQLVSPKAPQQPTLARAPRASLESTRADVCGLMRRKEDLTGSDTLDLPTFTRSLKLCFARYSSDGRIAFDGGPASQSLGQLASSELLE